MSGETASSRLLKLSAEIAAAYLANNTVAASEVPAVLRSIYGALSNLAGEPVPDGVQGPSAKPAVPIKKSITENYIVCLEDGAKLKMLKRYLRTRYDLSPEEYRAKWGLPIDYPMVAPGYAAFRSTFAKQIGLGKSSHRRTSHKR
ncbi:MAG TPA: MucR family transcriptional regulator [Rhizomicrobium sp.]